MKKNILIVSPDQYGYHTDDFYRIQYLKDRYNVTLICYDLQKVKKDCNDINIIYIKYTNSKSKNKYEMFNSVRKYIKNQTVDIIYLRYFFNCYFLKFFIGKKKCILDIRTGSVSPNKLNRLIYNTDIKFSTYFFDGVTIISSSLSEKLGIKKAKVIPLGANRLVPKLFLEESFKEMRLIYVGTFDNRNIDVTIKGFNEFYNKYNNITNISYTLIGDSVNKDEVIKIKNLISEIDNPAIKYLGRIDNKDLGEYLVKADVGISYIPINEYYNNQPPTKTFEYLMNGLICLATNTYENNKIINSTNGVLVNDEINDFIEGLEKIYFNLETYDRREIYESIQHNSWNEIIYNNLIPYLELNIMDK